MKPTDFSNLSSKEKRLIKDEIYSNYRIKNNNIENFIRANPIIYFINDNKLTREELRLYIKKWPYFIKYIDNPSNEIIKISLNETKGKSIIALEQPTLEMQLLSIELNELNIFNIKNPCKEVLEKAIEKNGLLVGFLNVGSISKKNLYKSLESSNGESIQYIGTYYNSYNSLAKRAVAINGLALRHVRIYNLSRNERIEIWKTAIKNNWMAFKFIKNPPKEILEFLVNREPTSILWIPKPSKKLIEIAVKKIPRIIEYLKNPPISIENFAKKQY